MVWVAITPWLAQPSRYMGFLSTDLRVKLRYMLGSSFPSNELESDGFSLFLGTLYHSNFSFTLRIISRIERLTDKQTSRETQRDMDVVVEGRKGNGCQQPEEPCISTD